MTKLPAGFGELDWSDWIRGVISGFISGGASAVVSGFTVSAMDSKDYNVYASKFYVLVGAMFVTNGVLGTMAFLRTRPIPDVKHVTTTVQTTELQGKPVTAKIVTTVEEKHDEPLNKGEK